MLTLKEAEITLKTIKLLGYVGVLPFSCNGVEGKLEALPYYRLIFWHFCVFLTALNLLNSIYQAMNLYVLSDHADLPVHVIVIHIMYNIGSWIILVLVMYIKTKVQDVIHLFNELFTGAEMMNSTHCRRWKDTELVDLVLRLYVPALTFYCALGWPLLLVVEPNMPIQPINSCLLAPLKEFRILVVLFGILDAHVFVFIVLNFCTAVFILYISCEKIKMVGRATRNSLSLLWLNHRLIRRAMKTARSIQLQILLTNHFGCWIIFTQKVIFILCFIMYAFIVIRAFSQNIFLGVYACGVSITCILSWCTTCYFANLVPKETRSLRHDIISSYRPFFKADVIKYMRSVRLGYVQDGRFRGIEQESFLIFVGFVANQLVALLLI